MAASNVLLLDEEVEDWSLPIWREALAGPEWLKLRCSKVYWGFGVPRGDKSAVVLVPGFLGHDIYLSELYLWLCRIGYTPFMSHIGRHADCPNVLVEHLLKTIRRAHKKTGRPVHIIGHSLGGVLGLGAAAHTPELIGKVVTMGSPIRGAKAHPFVLWQAKQVRGKIRRHRYRRAGDQPLMHDCFTYHCACGFSRNTRENVPAGMPQMAIYSKTDGIVNWEMCVTDNPKQNQEVTGTHCGLAWNAEVYGHIARLLSPATSRKAKQRK